MAKSRPSVAARSAKQRALMRRVPQPGAIGLSRQERFCRLVALRDMAIVAAYCIAFEWKGSEKKAKRTVLRLMDLPAIQQRIRELRAQLVPAPNGGRSLLTVEEHLAELALIEREAVAAGQFGPAATLAIARGKVSGLYIERSVNVSAKLEDIIAASRKRITSSVDETELMRGVKMPPLLGPLPDDD